MGYLINKELIRKKVTIASADFETCGTVPFLLLSGKPNMVFQFVSIMATTNGSYTSLSNYIITSSITNFEIAATHFDNYQTGDQFCIYSIGVNPSTDNTQKAGNDLNISIRSGVNPIGGGDVTFYIIYEELYF